MLLSELSPLENVILRERRKKDENWKKNKLENEMKLKEMTKIKDSQTVYMDIEEANEKEAKLLREQLNIIVPPNSKEIKIEENPLPMPEIKIKEAVQEKN
jgi:hypothetical protein